MRRSSKNLAKESSVPTSRGQRMLAATRESESQQLPARPRSVRSASLGDVPVAGNLVRKGRTKKRAASGPPTKKLAVSSDAPLHPNLLPRLPLPLQLWIASGVAPADLAAIGLVSKSARRFCELCFTNLQAFGTPGSDVDIPSLTLMLRFSTQLKAFDLGRLAVGSDQLRRLNERFADGSHIEEWGSYTVASLSVEARMLRNNAQTLLAPPSCLPFAARPLLAQCPRLQLLPWDYSVVPETLAEGLRPGQRCPREVTDAAVRAIVSDCSELCRLQLSCTSGDGVVTPELLLQFVNARPLRELLLRGCDVESLRAVSTCTTLGALTKLAVSTARFVWFTHTTLLAAVVPLVDLCRDTLQELCLQAHFKCDSVDLGSLPTLRVLRLPEVRVKFRLRAPRLTELCATDFCFAESGWQPSAFPLLNELRIYGGHGAFHPVGFAALADWRSLTALRLSCRRESAQKLMLFLLRALPHLRELWLSEAGPGSWSHAEDVIRSTGTGTRFPNLRVIEGDALPSVDWFSLDLPGLTTARVMARAAAVVAAVKAAPQLQELVIPANGAADHMRAMLEPIQCDVAPLRSAARLHTVRVAVMTRLTWLRCDYAAFAESLVKGGDASLRVRAPTLRRVVLQTGDAREDFDALTSVGHSGCKLREFRIDHDARTVHVWPPLPDSSRDWRWRGDYF